MKSLAPDTGGDVDEALVALPTRLEPAIADICDLVADRLSLQDRRWRYEVKLLGRAVIVVQDHAAQAVEDVENRQGRAKVLRQLVAGPRFLEQPDRRRRRRAGQAGIEDDGVDSAATSVGGGLRAEQATTHDV